MPHHPPLFVIGDPTGPSVMYVHSNMDAFYPFPENAFRGQLYTHKMKW